MSETTISAIALYNYLNWIKRKVFAKENYKITVSGKDGNDAKRYQEKDVKDFLKDIKKAQK